MRVQLLGELLGGHESGNASAFANFNSIMTFRCQIGRIGIVRTVLRIN